MDIALTLLMWFLRYAFVLLALRVLVLVRRNMLHRPKSGRVLAVLEIDETQQRLAVTHYETTIGRSAQCDLVVDMPRVSRQHAVLTLHENGYWRIKDTGSREGTLINGQKNTDGFDIRIGDVITLADVTITLLPADTAVEPLPLQQPTSRAERLWARLTAPPKRVSSGRAILVWLNMFQLVALAQLQIFGGQQDYAALYISFFVLMLLPWIWHSLSRLVGVRNKAAEALAFLLSTIGMCAVATAAPEELLKQTGALLLGFGLFCGLLIVLKNLELAMALRRYAAVITLVFLSLVLIPGLGVSINGQKNWIGMGSFTLQPSEFAKVLFVFAGAATLQWLLTTKNLMILSLYAVGCMGLLFVAGDFGTALVFFVAFLALILLTSGDWRALLLTGAAAGLGGGLVLRYRPYVANRFAIWGRAFSDVYGLGWQQSRTLMAIASGGFFGLGAGGGSLARVAAADTDLVFGVVCEQWGLLAGALVIWGIGLFLRGAMRTATSARSSYYVIAACAAGVIFVFQASLNIFGCTDVLPFTGVTLPFVSNGGSSMAASWCMLAFITAAINYTRPGVEPITVPVQSLGAQGRRGAKRSR